jgi:hypothetical protein
MTKTATRQPRVVAANRTPRIEDLIAGTVIYRWAAHQHPGRITSELPCHADQLVSVEYDPSRTVQIDQPVVCRRCFTSYAATPVPDTEINGLRIAFCHTGNVEVSRQKRSRL